MATEDKATSRSMPLIIRTRWEQLNRAARKTQGIGTLKMDRLGLAVTGRSVAISGSGMADILIEEDKDEEEEDDIDGEGLECRSELDATESWDDVPPRMPVLASMLLAIVKAPIYSAISGWVGWLLLSEVRSTMGNTRHDTIMSKHATLITRRGDSFNDELILSFQ